MRRSKQAWFIFFCMCMIMVIFVRFAFSATDQSPCKKAQVDPRPCRQKGEKPIEEILGEIIEDEQKMNGKVGFSFSSNESDDKNWADIKTNISIDHGIYPYEMDVSFDMYANIRDGESKENISDIDVSFDFHPMSMDENNPGDNLAIENYIFLSRFNDDFIGIDQKYEIGGGIIVNSYSNSLTEKGITNHKKMINFFKLKKKEFYSGNCMDICQQIGDSSLAKSYSLKKQCKRCDNITRKKYAKRRMALLFGLFYEVEKNTVTDQIRFNDVDTSMTKIFPAINRFCWEIRPTMAWKPNDQYLVYANAYFKFPFEHLINKVHAGNLSDERLDCFIDIDAGIQVDVDKRFSIEMKYRLIYDHAPRRMYLEQQDGSYVLLKGQNRDNGFRMQFGFNF